MKIVTLEPYLAELVCHLGLEKALVGAVAGSALPDELRSLPRITRAAPGRGGTYDAQQLKSLAPDILLAAPPEPDEKALRAELSGLLGEGVRIFTYRPQTLIEVLEMYEQAGKDLGQPAAGHHLHDRFKAQVMDWTANFYDRVKGKRVAVLVGLEPLTLAGLWVPGMAAMLSSVSVGPAEGKPHQKLSWRELSDLHPDVAIIAPVGMTLEQSMRTFKSLEKLPEWEGIVAVKRGQVYFTDGMTHFVNPASLVDSMGMLVSALGGMDSGYITPRDSFYRLRWLELQRHKL